MRAVDAADEASRRQPVVAGRGLAAGGGRVGLDADEVDPSGNRKSLNVALGWVTDRNLAIADAVKEVAFELGRTPAQVALAWALNAPGVTAPIIGARTIAQLEDNLGDLQVDITPSQLTRLDEVSAIDLVNPHDLLASDHIRTVTTGDMKIEILG